MRLNDTLVAPTVAPPPTLAPGPPPPGSSGPPLPPLPPPGSIATFGPPQIPIAQAGLSQEYIRAGGQVGSGPAGRLAPETLASTPLPGDLNVAPDLVDQINRRGVYAPAPPPTLQNWERDASGRPTATRLGVDQGMGGMPQPADRTWAPSNVLIQQALANLPPIFQQFANQHIDRFAVTDVYGKDYGPTNQGGYYQPQGPDAGTVAVGRGNDVTPFAGQSGPMDPVAVAEHELMHKLSYEVPPYREDSRSGFAGLQDAVKRDWASLMSSPMFQKVTPQLAADGQKGDWGHVFTNLGLIAAKGVVLPPALAHYFSPMLQTGPQVAVPPRG